jgi:hypothetical protein
VIVVVGAPVLQVASGRDSACRVVSEHPHLVGKKLFVPCDRQRVLSDTVVGDGGVVGRGDRGVVNEETN